MQHILHSHARQRHRQGYVPSAARSIFHSKSPNQAIQIWILGSDGCYSFPWLVSIATPYKLVPLYWSQWAISGSSCLQLSQPLPWCVPNRSSSSILYDANFREGTPRWNMTSISSKVRSFVSGSRNQPQTVVRRYKLPQKNAWREERDVNTGPRYISSVRSWLCTYRLALRIPRSGAHEIRFQNTTNEVRKLIHRPAQHNRLRSETRGPDLCNNSINNGADTHRVRAQPDYAHD